MLPRWIAPMLFPRSDDLPPPWPDDPFPEIVSLVRRGQRKIVVLDDDPTGTQTVHDVAVLTKWDIETLTAELQSPASVFYILTNSRSLPEAAAIGLTREIALNLRAAALRTGADLAIVSRSDSTLRGHFPAETDALAGSLQQRDAPWIIAPFFEAGGRRTIGDVHFVDEGGKLVPVGETSFARDPVFSFKSSNLREWVEEKTRGRISAKDVMSVSLDHIRIGGPDNVRHLLAKVRGGTVCIVNAAVQRDIETFMLGLLRAEAEGQRFLYRTAASFAALRAGMRVGPLLTTQRLNLPSSRVPGGLVVVGSFVDRTTTQLNALLKGATTTSVCLEVSSILNPGTRRAEISRVAEISSRLIATGEDAIVYTSRSLIRAATTAENVQIAQTVSDALIAVVRALTVRPRFFVAKGGITSSDLAVKALGVERATVLGQLLPGVPVWRLQSPARWPDLVYVVFPGNVGEPEALREAIAKLAAA